MSFLYFQRLPPEIQLKIWHFSLPQPRIIDIFAALIAQKLQERMTPNVCNSDARSAVWVQTFVERVYSTPQPSERLLHVNRMTRSLVLQRYSVINVDVGVGGPRSFRDLPPVIGANGVETIYSHEQLEGNRPFALVDPRCDIVFLQDKNWMPRQDLLNLVSDLEILVRWLDRGFVENLQCLAIPYYTWRKTRSSGGLKVLLRFKGLKRIFVSFMAGRPQHGHPLWSDATDELAGHIGEVEAEVRDDVENLARKHLGWTKPGYAVVKHRDILLKEL